MEAVHRDVITLPPLAFPWRRAVPGMVALLAAFGMAIWRFIVALNNETSNVLLDEQLRQLFGVGTRSEIQWVIIAIALTIVSVLLPLRLMRGRV
jgi:multidrug efflux pump subunit AcrB